eukprot:gene5562-7684_t
MLNHLFRHRGLLCHKNSVPFRNLHCLVNNFKLSKISELNFTERSFCDDRAEEFLKTIGIGIGIGIGIDPIKKDKSKKELILETLQALEKLLSIRTIANADDLINNLKLLNSYRVIIPSSYYYKIIRIFTSRKDANRTEIILYIAKQNLSLFRNNNSSYIYRHTKSQPYQDPLNKIISYAISSLLTQQEVGNIQNDDAFKLWINMSNVGYVATRFNLEMMMEQIGNSFRNSNNSHNIDFIDQIHSSIKLNQWHQNPQYYSKLLKVYRQILKSSSLKISSAENLIIIRRVCERLINIWNEIQQNSSILLNTGKMINSNNNINNLDMSNIINIPLDLYSMRTHCWITAVIAYKYACDYEWKFSNTKNENLIQNDDNLSSLPTIETIKNYANTAISELLAACNSLDLITSSNSNENIIANNNNNNIDNKNNNNNNNNSIGTKGSPILMKCKELLNNSMVQLQNKLLSKNSNLSSLENIPSASDLILALEHDNKIFLENNNDNNYYNDKNNYFSYNLAKSTQSSFRNTINDLLIEFAKAQQYSEVLYILDYFHSSYWNKINNKKNKKNDNNNNKNDNNNNNNISHLSDFHFIGLASNVKKNLAVTTESTIASLSRKVFETNNVNFNLSTNIFDNNNNNNNNIQSTHLKNPVLCTYSLPSYYNKLVIPITTDVSRLRSKKWLEKLFCDIIRNVTFGHENNDFEIFEKNNKKNNNDNITLNIKNFPSNINNNNIDLINNSSTNDPELHTINQLKKYSLILIKQAKEWFQLDLTNSLLFQSSIIQGIGLNARNNNLSWESTLSATMYIIDQFDDTNISQNNNDNKYDKSLLYHEIIVMLCDFREKQALSQAISIIHDMTAQGLSVQPFTLCAILRSGNYCLNNIDLFIILNEIEELLVVPINNSHLQTNSLYNSTNIHRKIGSRDVQETYLYRILTNARIGDAYSALKLLQKLRRLGGSVSFPTYRFIIHSLYLSRPHEENHWNIVKNPLVTIQYLTREMIRDGHLYEIIDYHSNLIPILLSLFVKAIQIAYAQKEGPLQLLSLMKSTIDTIVHTGFMNLPPIPLNDGIVNEFVKAHIIMELKTEALKFLSRIEKEYNMKLTAKCYETIIFHYCVVKNQMNQVDDILTSMSNKNIIPNNYIIDSIIINYIQNNELSEGLDKVMDIYNQTKAKPSVKGILRLLDASLTKKDFYESKRVVYSINQMFTEEDRNNLVGFGYNDASYTTKYKPIINDLKEKNHIIMNQIEYLDFPRTIKKIVSFGNVPIRGVLSNYHMRNRFAAVGLQLKI